MITVKQIKKVVTDSGNSLVDARTASWKTTYGFTVTQDNGVPQKYIMVRPCHSDMDTTSLISKLTELGIKYGYHLGVFYIHPEQMDV